MSTLAIRSPAWQIRFDRPAQIRAGIVVLAFAAVFYRVLLDLNYAWMKESDWSHGPIIPLFSIWLAYSQWDHIKRAPVTGTWVGLLIMLGGLGVYDVSLWGVLPFGYVRALAMMVALFGVIVFLCGLPMMRWAWLSWAYLFFAIPLPKGIYFMLTDPLRQMAAVVATGVMSLMPDLTIQRAGSVIEYVYKGQFGMIGVADACSGMRSTMTLCALGVAVTFLSARPWWQRIIMVGSCIPIAVFCNFIRVTTTSALHIFVDAKYATGHYHMTLGLLMLLIAFGIFSGLGWVLSHIFVEETEPDATTA
ncbi:MAG: exosortase/archaeosortase family protein [Planctomycetes bacterium]|nr:exosortase/archaeosortase family protein [Planctomycetota bacterium]